MAIFLVSFLVFAGVALLLVLSQRARGGQLPVGCTPESGTCCRAGSFGNCIGPTGTGHGTVKGGSVEQWQESKQRP